MHATSFPVNFASTMSWDPSLVYQETTAVSDEARGFLDQSLFGSGQNNLGPSASDYGSLTYWAPNVNMDRDPRWGRTNESFGEDPYLTGQMAGAFVDGYQGETMSGQPMTPYLKVAATAKHYALNNVDDTRRLRQLERHGREHPRLLHQAVPVPGGELARVRRHDLVQRGQRHAAAGQHLHGQRAAGQHLRVRGYTTSDCGAIGDIYTTNAHDWAPPGWTTDGTTWTNTATGRDSPRRGGRPGVRAARGHPAQLHR